MHKSHWLKVILSVGVFTAAAFPDTVDLGYVAFDVSNPPLAEVDVVNLTGVNSASPDFPVSTLVSFTDLNLTVNFSSGPPETFSSSSSYFTLDPDGQSYDGQDIFNSTTNPVTSVTLTGDYSPASGTSGGLPVAFSSSSFSATITDPSGTLVDGDLALLTASTGGGVTPPPPPAVPEPKSYLLIGAVLTLFALYSKRSLLNVGLLRRLGILLVGSSIGLFSATTPVTLAQDTSPSSGTSGSSDVWVTGSGFPSGSFVSATVTLASSCPATTTSTPAIAEKAVVGSTERVEFLVPASLATGTYYVSLNGSTTGGAFSSGSSCSQIQVTHTSAVLASCNPGSSMGILAYNPSNAAKTPVTAYVPNGYWYGGTTGVQVVPLEPSGAAPSTLTTPNPINSCSSNSLTGESVCIDNYTDIYLVKGSSVTTTLTSGANTYAAFSGGDCENCTVAVNEAAGTQGQAVIGIGLSSATSGTGLQFLDLATNTLGAPVPLTQYISEDILWDPFRNLVLSPNEQSYYALAQVSGSGVPSPSTVTELTAAYIGPEFDSAAEDCTTQIALSSNEFDDSFYIADLSQKAISSGSYTAPGQVFTAPEFGEFDAGTDGIAVAPGSTHLAVVTGEYGGNQFGAVLLPSTSGSGTPAPVDYVAAQLPATPDGCSFATGYDPHTTTAYTSPNDGKAYGVLADWYVGEPSYVALVDLQALINAPRVAGIYPSGDSCGSSCTHTVDPSYDLVANGIVSYVATGNATCATSDAVDAHGRLKSDATKPKPVNRKTR